MAKFIFQAGVFFKRPLYPANTSTVVTVYDAETGSIAPIWNDRAGADPRANPGPIWQEGQIKFYANPGRYNIVASNGSDSKVWEDVIIIDPNSGGSGGGGASSFLDLDDTPISYSGQAGKVVRVNSSETALEFSQFGPPLSVDTASSSYTLSMEIWNQIKNITGDGTVDIIIPLDSTLDLPIGYTHIVRPRSSFSGTCTWVKEDASMTLEAPDGGTLVCGPNMTSAATKIASNSWIIYGVTEAA